MTIISFFLEGGGEIIILDSQKKKKKKLKKFPKSQNIEYLIFNKLPFQVSSSR
jgi:hypothetical protein